ncbi:MAG: hypothetical protein ACYTJ0_11975 [Planctomycetota bacterium]|jgi:hypothetical protein
MSARNESRRPRTARRTLLLAAIAAATGTLAFTGTARAGHDDKRPPVVRPHVTNDVLHCSSPMYIAGQRAGTQTGWADGHCDGRSGIAPRPQPRQGLKPYSIHYRQGFKAGYRATYDRGYQAGLRERQRFTCFGWRPSWLFSLR